VVFRSLINRKERGNICVYIHTLLLFITVLLFPGKHFVDPCRPENDLLENRIRAPTFY
jgi:hypothetical protein